MIQFPPASIVSLNLDALDEYAGRLPGTMILALDEHGGVRYANSLFLQATGYPASILVRRSVRQLSDSALFEKRAEPQEVNIYNRNVVKPEPVRFRKANGKLLNVFLSSIVAETDGGILFLLLMNNAEHPQSADSTLVHRFGETMLTDEHIGVILLQSEEARIVEISPLVCRLLGVAESAALNEPLRRFFADAKKEYALIRQAFAGGPAVRNYPITWTKGNERTELLMDVGLFRSAAGGIDGGYILFKDVTNLRSLEVQVQRSDRLAMIGQIAAGAAHEIRNPLTAIRGFLQMFRKSMVEREMAKETEYTDIMLTELDRINDLVSEFLMLSKPRHVVHEQVDLEAVLRDIMPVVTSEAVLHGVSVGWKTKKSLPRVVADGEMLKQVFLNICKNGIEAMAKGGSLTLTTYVRSDDAGDWLVTDIQDSGPGIPIHMLDKIFDPFVTTKANGTGLGLSVCQRIMHDFGGSVRADTKETGALFTILLPIPQNGKRRLSR